MLTPRRYLRHDPVPVCQQGRIREKPRTYPREGRRSCGLRWLLCGCNKRCIAIACLASHPKSPRLYCYRPYKRCHHASHTFQSSRHAERTTSEFIISSGISSSAAYGMNLNVPCWASWGACPTCSEKIPTRSDFLTIPTCSDFLTIPTCSDFLTIHRQTRTLYRPRPVPCSLRGTGRGAEPLPRSRQCGAWNVPR